MSFTSSHFCWLKISTLVTLISLIYEIIESMTLTPRDLASSTFRLGRKW